MMIPLDSSLPGSLRILQNESERPEDRERFISTLISNLPGFVYRCRNDPHWTMEFIAGACEDVTGYSRDALVDNRERSYASLIHPDDRIRVRGAVQVALEKREPFEIEYRILRPPEDEEAWVSERGRGVFSEDGELSALEGFVFDVTERHRAEVELAAREKELHQAQKMEALGLMAGGLAHDLNNLFTVAAGYCQLIQTDLESNGEPHPEIREVRGAIDRAAHLVKQVASLGRRQEVLQAREVDLDDVVRGTAGLISRVLRDNIELNLDLSEDDLWTVEIDPSQIEQVLLNLSINAEDAMPDGGRLTIRTRNVVLDEAYADRRVTVDPGAYILLSVEDTGVGMDPDVLDRIFEPFFTTKEEGTGLGLSTTYGIVRQSGGNMFAYSEPGRGTSFRIYLPRASSVPVESHAVEPRIAEPTGGDERILVVEDEEPIRLLLKRVLSERGYDVVDAANGEEALEMSSDLRVDLLITDLVLPGINGQELVRLLVDRGVTRRAICCSGYSSATVMDWQMIDAETVFLPKPYTPNELLGTIRDVLAS